MTDNRKGKYRFQRRLKVEPVPEQPVPGDLDPELYRQGYDHGLKSNVLRDFRKSFRFGFRQAKIEQQEAAMKNVVILGTHKNKSSNS